MHCFILHLGSAIQLTLLLWVLIIFFQFCLWKTLHCNLDHAYILKQNANEIWGLKSSTGTGHDVGFAHGQGYNLMFFKDKTGKILPKITVTIIKFDTFKMSKRFLQMATKFSKEKKKVSFDNFSCCCYGAESMDGSITLAMKIGGAGAVKKSERCLSSPSPFFIRFSCSTTSNKTFHSLIFSTHVPCLV